MQARTTHTLMTCATVTSLIMVSCGESPRHAFTQAERYAADSVVKSARSMASLDSVYRSMKQRGDRLGEMALLREQGKRLRNESRFDEALEKHGEGLEIAEQTGDTIEWVQALNNIGTDYRRLGILDAALQYHKNALTMAEESADTSFTARKNRVVSFNGLANVYLTVGNLHLADSCLRQALAGETALGSLTGQAINYANLGSIFETTGKTDSAWAYYRHSMELNTRDGNTLGIALCHTYYGNLYKKAHQLDKALAEYNEAYRLMKDSKDEWHALNSLTALAGVYTDKGNVAKAESYLKEAKAIATSIHSTEHLAEIYTLYYKLRKGRSDWQGALLAFEQAAALKDSLIDMDKVNRMQSVSFNIERDQQTRRMTAANNKLANEKSVRLAGYVVFAVIIILLVVLIALLDYNRKLRSRSFHELKKLNSMRETFFRNITHEFRTPLTVILGLSHDLQQPNTSEDEAQNIGSTIERQGQRMLRLINQLLDLSKIKSEIGEPEWQGGDIVAYISMIVDSFSTYATKLGIKLQFVAREKSTETVFVPDYMNKVISNLLSNALKYTPQYGTVSVNLWREGHRLFIDVADTGRGIPAASLPHIFEEFYQSDNTDCGIGTGVGLVLVHHIVKTLSGTITVDSTEGKGSTFHIVIPIREATVSTNPTASPQPSPIGKGEVRALNTIQLEDDYSSLQEASPSAIGERRGEAEDVDSASRVLVVEDNADIAAFIGKQLNSRTSPSPIGESLGKASYWVAYASDGKKGLEKAKEWIPDIIITDLMMPEMDGLELCRYIRNDELISHIPIIVVTAKVTEAERIEGLKAGADAYLTKPFSNDELRTRVEILLDQRRQLREKFAKELTGSLSHSSPIGEGMLNPTAHPQAKARGSSSPSLIGEEWGEADRRFLTKVTDCVYLMLNGRKSVDVSAVASKMCMSYGQFNRKLNALTSYTPAQYIQRIKIKKAQRMLMVHPEKGFNDIAEQCGFSDYSNFVRAFKSICGITPTQFVRSVNND